MKRMLAIMLSLLFVVSLASCQEKTSPEALPPSSSQTSSSSAQTQVPEPEPNKICLPEGDSYWVLTASEEDVRSSWLPENIWTDLTLWADGTARIREIENGIWLYGEDVERDLAWECEEDGTFHLYSIYNRVDPYWSGTVTEDGITLNRYEGTFRFKQEPMPEGGNLYSPAELRGVWLQTSSEVEGCEEETMPEWFYSLIFRNDCNENGQTLLASSESGDFDGFIAGSGYSGREITLLDQPIYEGCGNDEWSVRIGEESPLNENGYPEQVETYVTLLDKNTLLQQQYFSFDGGPGVSYQIYKRVLPASCENLSEEMLADSAFEMSGWIDGDGILHSAPPGVSDFSLQLDGNGGYRFTVTGEDGSKHTGGGDRWSLGDGGTILMRCEDWEPDDYLNGAVQTANGPEELFLWYNGGILWCQIVDGGGNWDGYVDTMTELEGNAFAAPQNALLVLYNQYYVDFDAAQFTTYELSDGPGAQYLLATAVVDGTKLWLEEDGFVVGDFGTLDAGESVLLWTGIPEENGPNLNFIVNGESYYYELNQNNIAFPDHWDYLIG